MDWQPIETHPQNEDECLLAIIDSEGRLYVADRGGWTPGRIHKEWDEVEEGISIKLWGDQEDGSWWSNHCIIDEPTHWMPITDKKKDDFDSWASRQPDFTDPPNS